MTEKEQFKALIHEALDRGWTDLELADMFRVSQGTIRRWSSGEVVPGPQVRAGIIKQLGFGPLNQCEHPDMQSDDEVHWHCPDCGLGWDEGAQGSEETFWADYMTTKEEWDSLKDWNEV